MDIVERLRMPTQEFHRLHTDAADEIEKLRQQLAAVTKELQAADDELNDFAECIAINRMYEKQIAELRSAVKNLIDVKGRFHTEQAYKNLVEVFDRTAPKEEV